MLLNSHISAHARCIAENVCGLVQSTWGTSQGEDKLGARDKILNTKVVRRACAGRALGKHSPYQIRTSVPPNPQTDPPWRYACGSRRSRAGPPTLGTPSSSRVRPKECQHWGNVSAPGIFCDPCPTGGLLPLICWATLYGFAPSPPGHQQMF